MSQDLQQYAQIIEQLKPMVKEPEFNQVLNQMASELPKEKRFLLKMELKRLAKPCLRAIDLRGQVDGECRIYQYAGISHYLDDVAIEVFENQARIFGGYTFGVYEKTLQTENNFKVLREKAEKRQAKEEKRAEEDKIGTVLSKYDVPVVNLLEYAQRSQERMNFASAIEIFSEDNTSTRGTSVDISKDGLKVRIGVEHIFKSGERLSLYFRGIESEFALDKKQGIVYHIVKIVRERDFQFLMLKRAPDFPNAGFDQFLEKFIHGNKRRYKVNMTNTIDAIINKSCEQYFSPRSPTLPVFVEVVDGIPAPRYAMLNEVNRDIISYWNDENDELKIGFMLNEKRLKYLVNKALPNRDIYVYAFNHIQDGKVYFYSATAQELAEKAQLRDLYLSFGSRKVSWRVFKISLSDMDPNQAHAPLSLPDSVGTKIKRQNAPPAPRLMARLKNLKYIAQITDVTSDYGQQRYARLKLRRDNLAHLRAFGHPRNRMPAQIKPFRYKYQEQRMETRYLLRSALTMTFKDQEFVGISEDISVHGLRVEIQGEFEGEVNHRVFLGFPRLQEITNKHNVMNLQYRVVHISFDKNILHLKAVSGEEGQTARHFFDELIKQNRSQLKAYPDEEEIPGIGHALRCINAKNTSNMAFVLQKEGARFVPQAAVTSATEHRLNAVANHFASQGNTNVEFLFRDRNLEDPFIQLGLKQVKVENQPVRQEMFIAYDPGQKESRMAIIPRFNSRFASDEMRYNFIKEALTRGQFIAISVLLTTTNKPDLEQLQAEINYVSVYAIHRAKELEERLWSVVGCVYLTDITDEVLLRYRIDNDLIESNQSRPSPVKMKNSGIEQLLKQ